MTNRHCCKMLAILLLLLLSAFSVIAQQKIVSGFVFAKNSKEPLIGANVFIIEKFTGTTTNNYGFFSLQIPAKSDGLQLGISYIGYNQQIILLDSLEDNGIFFLSRGLNIEEVKIFHQPKIEERVEMSMFHLPLSEIELMPQLFQEDLIKSIQFLPGIQGGQEGSAGMYVRGGDTEQNLVLLDDVPIYYANHAGNLVSIFDNNTIKDFKLYKGAFPARYGGRMSSVLDIRMKEGDKVNYHGEVGLGIISGNIFLEGPLIKDKVSFFISYRKFWPSYLLDLFTNGETKYSFSDFSAKITADLSTKEKLTISCYSGGDKFQMLKPKREEGESYANATTNWRNTIASLKYTRKISNKLFTDVTAYYTKYDYLYNNQAYFKEPDDISYNNLYTEYSSMIADYSLKAEFEYYLSSQTQFKFGSQLINHTYLPGASQYGSTSTNFDIDKTVIFNKLNSYEPSLFAEMNYSVNRNFNVNAGIRNAYIIGENFHYSFIEPRLLVSYDIKNIFAIKASYGHMNQNINRLNYSTTGFQNDIWLPPTNIVKPGKSKQGALGFFKTFNNASIELSIEAYYKHLSNLIAFKPGESFFAGNNSWDQKIETNGVGEAQGIELYIQKKEGKLTGWISYTLAKATRQFKNKNNGLSYPFNYDRRHDFSIVGNYPLNEQWNLSGTFIFGSGYPITLAYTEYMVQDVNFSYQQDIGNIFNSFVAIQNYKGINAFRMENYHRFDIAFTYKKKKKNTERIWNFSIYNLYNRKNPFYYEYILNANGQNQLYKFSMFPFLPSISYSVKF